METRHYVPHSDVNHDAYMIHGLFLYYSPRNGFSHPYASYPILWAMESSGRNSIACAHKILVFFVKPISVQKVSIFSIKPTVPGNSIVKNMKWYDTIIQFSDPISRIYLVLSFVFVDLQTEFYWIITDLRWVCRHHRSNQQTRRKGPMAISTPKWSLLWSLRSSCSDCQYSYWSFSSQI